MFLKMLMNFQYIGFMLDHNKKLQTNRILNEDFILSGNSKKIIDVFLSKKFEGGRHTNRVSKINC